MLVLVEFSHKTCMNHGLARDILSGVDWDLPQALEAAELMDYPQDDIDFAKQSTKASKLVQQGRAVGT